MAIAHRCYWSQLGKPKRAGIVTLGGATVLVTSEDINTAASLGGDPIANLIDVETANQSIPTYQISDFG